MNTLNTVALSIVLSLVPIAISAQGAGSSGPSEMPDEAKQQIDKLGGQATPNSVTAPEAPPVDLSTFSGDKYVYTTLRNITKSNARGCAVNDWACMSRLCKQDLGSNAWRGWAGCNPHNNDFICYFECALVRDAF
ncbi:MAG: hypothetical protein OXQ92_15875 [Boseongicola sp.]|nr:hypothetical protein [Boseongicola sp.]MDD9979714.1 hypothetical protein [Boseongicola sp.]